MITGRISGIPACSAWFVIWKAQAVKRNIHHYPSSREYISSLVVKLLHKSNYCHPQMT